MDKTLCQASEQIGWRPRFILSTSLKLAITALPGTARDAANPVEPDRGLSTVSTRRRTGARRAYPALLGHTLFPAVRMLQGDKGARDRIAAVGEHLLEMPVDDPSIEIDIDTKEDPRLLHGIRLT